MINIDHLWHLVSALSENKGVAEEASKTNKRLQSCLNQCSSIIRSYSFEDADILKIIAYLRVAFYSSNLENIPERLQELLNMLPVKAYKPLKKQEQWLPITEARFADKIIMSKEFCEKANLKEDDELSVIAITSTKVVMEIGDRIVGSRIGSKSTFKYVKSNK